MTAPFDANWLDAACMATALANAVIQKFRKSFRWFDRHRLVPELFNGAAMPPVALLILGAGYSPLLTLLLQASRVTLFLAGLVALLALLDISFGEDAPPTR